MEAPGKPKLRNIHRMITVVACLAIIGTVAVKAYLMLRVEELSGGMGHYHVFCVLKKPISGLETNQVVVWHAWKSDEQPQPLIRTYLTDSNCVAKLVATWESTKGFVPLEKEVPVMELLPLTAKEVRRCFAGIGHNPGKSLPAKFNSRGSLHGLEIARLRIPGLGPALKGGYNDEYIWTHDWGGGSGSTFQYEFVYSVVDSNATRGIVVHRDKMYHYLTL